MTREIKFRAWDKKDKLWVAGFNIPQSGINTEWGDKVLMQFTGLKDKNGKEIYEGDIVKLKYGPPYEVKYSQKDAMFILTTTNSVGLGMDLVDKEIIGNVWENSDLLKP